MQQGCGGDLLVGLPTQMTEIHPPVRGLFVVDAPVARVEAVLSRCAPRRAVDRGRSGARSAWGKVGVGWVFWSVFGVEQFGWVF